MTLQKYQTPNGGVDLHVKHPRPPPIKGQPHQWPDFTPPASAQSRCSNGLVCHRRAYLCPPPQHPQQRISAYW